RVGGSSGSAAPGGLDGVPSRPPRADELLMTLTESPIAAETPPNGDLPSGDQPSAPPPAERGRPPVLAIVLIAIVPIAVLIVYELVITGFMYDQRQQHLSADFRQPRPKTANGQPYGVLQVPKLVLHPI